MIHKVGESGAPLEGLAGSHAPTYDGVEVSDLEVFGDELVLGTDVLQRRGKSAEGSATRIA